MKILQRQSGMTAYADECLDHAKQLFSFADNFRGKYSDVIFDVQSFYNSWSGYNDELMWGSAWIGSVSKYNHNFFCIEPEIFS